MTIPLSKHQEPHLMITEPVVFAEMAAITDLYPTKTVEEKRVMREDSLRPEFAASQCRHRTVLLARVGIDLVGTVQVVWEGAAEESALTLPGSAVIHHLRVHPEYRGRGIGQQLLLAAEHLAIQHGSDALTLGVEPDNTGARRLYQKQGFRDFITYAGPQGETIIGMKKPLPSN